ncbi:GntR family transcriptional regulator [Roseovarius pelagicus]|uniref:GntR family transcriptional regulator n=1 Tax=Roseovarius pelagicus TaxID=2980108 RepID=A0ABY6D9M5_9RHOB|nr:GntR family transcriptional regulator [Roseovarius pelagicus]UXX82842.1 GntR family transcriptional regulator [Roseovarius pelagicus]
MTRSSKATVDTAYEQLRDRLVTFGFKPGSRLNESEIAIELSMSRAPVREALSRLIADGLVSFEPGRGFFCRRLSVSEVNELYELRFDLESGALNAALAAADDAALDRFATTWQQKHADADTFTLDELVSLDEAFHLEMSSLAQNTARLKYLENINYRIRFVRRINLDTGPRRVGGIEEHSDLIDAIRRRDIDNAIGLLRHHLQRSADEVRLQVQDALNRIYADDVA